MESSYSRICFEFPMERIKRRMYAFKVLTGLYVAVLIGVLALFVKPSRLDVRFTRGRGRGVRCDCQPIRELRPHPRNGTTHAR